MVASLQRGLYSLFFACTIRIGRLLGLVTYGTLVIKRIGPVKKSFNF